MAGALLSALCVVTAAFAAVGRIVPDSEKTPDLRLPDEQEPHYEAHPLLKKAYVYWSDWKNRRRQVAIRLFEEYVEAEPDSPFLPEIHFHIAELHSTARNTRFGERPNRALATQYYRMAREGYGDKYSHLNRTAWATLANYGRETKKMREYYHWLRRLEESATIDDIYPIREIGVCLRGLPPTISEEEKRVRLKNLRKTIPVVISVAERNMFAIATPTDLAAYVSGYPGTELARQSEMALKRVIQREGDAAVRELEADLENEILLDAEAVTDAGDQEPDVESAGSLEAAAEATPGETADAAKPAKQPSLGIRLALLLAAVAVLVILAALYKRSRSKRAQE